MRIILLGPPGSGKGTQSTYISNYFNITHLSTGNILRSEVNLSTDLGIIAKKYMDKGDLIPDDLMIKAIKNQIINLSSGFLLDGFPRTLAQAKSLDLLLEQIEKPLDKIICLNVSKKEILNRLSFRAICNDCSHNYNLVTSPPRVKNICDLCGGTILTRSDDNPEAIINRLTIYDNLTLPVIDYYESTTKCFSVKAFGKPEDVFKTIQNLLRF